MCGMWLAFEDIDAENGPLFYYSKSHKWPSIGNEHIGVSNHSPHSIYENYWKFVKVWEELARLQSIKRETFRAKAGQALIWSSNLVHGGSPMIDKNRTRWSQVSHYFFDGCVYTVPVANDVFHGQVYFRDLADVLTGKKVDHVVSGVKVEQSVIDKMQPVFAKGFKLPEDFNPVKYLNLYLDVKGSGVDASAHYLSFGRAEGRIYK